MNKGDKNKWNNQHGYALYIVVVVSFLIFMVLSQILAYYVNQVTLVQMKEDSLRAHLLLQSAVVLWLEQLDEEELEQLTEEQSIGELEFAGGIVRFYKLRSIHETEWAIRVSARPYHNDVRHRVELRIDKETRQIIHWTESIS